MELKRQKVDRDVDDKINIWKMKLDGSGKTQISKNKNIDFMKIEGKYIYFLTSAHNRSRIYKMNIDGTDMVKLVDTHNLIYNISILDGNVYYIDDLKRNDINDESYSYISYDKGWYSTIYKVSSDFKNTSIKTNIKATSTLQIIDNKLYYYDSDKLSRMNVDGSNFQVISK